MHVGTIFLPVVIGYPICIAIIVTLNLGVTFVLQATYTTSEALT